MSLINEALRKAQSQRAQSPELGGASKTGNRSVNYVDRPNRLGLMIGLGLCIIFLMGLVAGLTVVLLNKDSPRATAQPATAESESTVSEPDTQPAIDNQATKLTETAPKIAKITTPETEPAKSKPAEPAPVPTAKPNQEIIDWLAQSTITGVRITSSSSKVILNNKAFVPGNSVNMTFGLRILEIKAERIIFIDSNGVEYVKLF